MLLEVVTDREITELRRVEVPANGVGRQTAVTGQRFGVQRRGQREQGFHEIGAHLSTLVGKTLRCVRIRRVEQQPGRFHGAAGQNEGACCYRLLGAVTVDIDGAPDLVVRACLKLQDVRAGDDRAIAAGFGLGDDGDVDAAAVESRTAAQTIAAVVALRASVVGPGECGTGIGAP